jgi:hypothetical protein
MITRSIRARVLGSVAVLSVAFAACSAGASVTTVPTSAPPVSTLPVSPSSTPTAGPQAIPDGTYVGPTMQVADLIALINGDPKLSTAQKTDIIDNAFAINGHQTFGFSLDLHGGQYQQGQSIDRGAYEIGSRGTYAFPDQHTLVLDEQGGLSVNTFQITVTATGFTLKRTDTSTDAEDILMTKIFWEFGPFTLAP